MAKNLISLTYADLRNANWAIRRKIIETLNKNVRDALPEYLKPREELSGKGENGERYSFSTPELEARNLLFAIEFESGNYGKCFFGFKNTNSEIKSLSAPSLEQAFKNEFNSFNSSQWWPAWEWLTPRDWNDDVFAAIQFGKFHEEIVAIVKKLKLVADKITQDSVMA